MESLNIATGWLLFLSVIIGIGYLPVPVEAAQHTISIENMKFVPENFKVSKGDTIIWINRDIVPHTVTSLNHKFDSKIILPNQKWSYMFVNSGAFPYKCDLHPTMIGKIVVK